MKKYYSVKEAAKVLGVSTNTIYKYIEDGKITSRRIGRGRIKIPGNVLEPYLQVQSPQQLVRPENASPEGKISNTSESFEQEVENNLSIKEKNLQIEQKSVSVDNLLGVKQEFGDILFFRLFKGLTFFGLAILYFFTKSEIFNSGGLLFSNYEGLVNFLLPTGLAVVSLFNLSEVFSKRLNKFHTFADILTVFVVGFMALVSLALQNYGIFVFTSAFAINALGHLISDARGDENSFYKSFARFSLYIAIIGGVIVTFYPQFLPIDVLTEFIFSNKGLFSMIWLIALVSPLIYLNSSFGKTSEMRLPFFVLASVLALIFATELTVDARWDLAYIAYIAGFFGIFIGWWTSTTLVIEEKRIPIISFSFIWIASTILFAIFALRSSREGVKNDALANMTETADSIVATINAKFDEQSAVITSVAGRSETKEIIKRSDSEAATLLAKSAFERLEKAERVIIYDGDGIAQGVYPRNTLIQGTNFSSREYFQRTLSSYKGYISPVFENILGVPTIIHTEPIFEDNKFIGMIAISLDLSRLAAGYQVGTTFKYDIHATDENGIVVLDSAESKIGRKLTEVSSQTGIYDPRKEILRVDQEARIPGWDIAIETPLSPLIASISTMNIILSILLVVNAVFSIAASVAASVLRNKPLSQLSETLPSRVVQNPRFI